MVIALFRLIFCLKAIRQDSNANDYVNINPTRTDTMQERTGIRYNNKRKKSARTNSVSSEDVDKIESLNDSHRDVNLHISPTNATPRQKTITTATVASGVLSDFLAIPPTQLTVSQTDSQRNIVSGTN